MLRSVEVAAQLDRRVKKAGSVLRGVWTHWGMWVRDTHTRRTVQFIRHHQSSPPRHLRGPETDWELQEILCSGSHQTVEFRLLKCTVICRWLISVLLLKNGRLLWTAIFFSLFLTTCKQRTCCLSDFNTDNYDILFFNLTIYIHTLISFNTDYQSVSFYICSGAKVTCDNYCFSLSPV